MPLYEYRCTKCQTLIELIQGFNDPPPKKCAKCGAAKLEKVISRSGFVLKGGGWYQTDYKSSSKATGSSKDSGESGSSKESDESSTSKESSAATPAADSSASKPSAASAPKKKPKNSPGN